MLSGTFFTDYCNYTFFSLTSYIWIWHSDSLRVFVLHYLFNKINKQTAFYLCCSCCSCLTAEIFTYLERCVIVLILKYVISLGLNNVMHCWKKYLLSCFSYIIFDWVLVSPWVLLHRNFCWPEDLWFSVWMCIFPSWLSLLWISSQKLDVHSDLILQGIYLYFMGGFCECFDSG